MTISSIKLSQNTTTKPKTTATNAQHEPQKEEKTKKGISTTTKAVALTSVVGGVGLYRFTQQLNMPIIKGALSRLYAKIFK